MILEFYIAVRVYYTRTCLSSAHARNNNLSLNACVFVCEYCSRRCVVCTGVCINIYAACRDTVWTSWGIQMKITEYLIIAFAWFVSALELINIHTAKNISFDILISVYAGQYRYSENTSTVLKKNIHIFMHYTGWFFKHASFIFNHLYAMLKFKFIFIKYFKPPEQYFYEK